MTARMERNMGVGAGRASDRPSTASTLTNPGLLVRQALANVVERVASPGELRFGDGHPAGREGQLCQLQRLTAQPVPQQPDCRS